MTTNPDFYEGFTSKEQPRIVKGYRRCAQLLLQGNRTEAYDQMTTLLDYYEKTQKPMPSAVTRLYVSMVTSNAVTVP